MCKLVCRKINKTLLVGFCLAMSFQVMAYDDPTRPAHFQSVVTKEPLKLESILYGATRKVAVINGKVLAEGETIGNKKLIHIGKDRVKLAGSNSEQTLTLKRTSIRQVK